MILQRCTHPRPCYDDGKCHYKGECGHKAPLTNSDRIRVMSDEELKEWYCKNRDCGGCDFCRPFGCTFKDWLQQTAEEEDKHEIV